MGWGTVELEPEVGDWLSGLNDESFGRAAFHIDRLEEKGALLDEPYTRQLDGKLRELRFYLAGQPTRISYYIARGRRIVLLTLFAKTRQQERHEVARAKRAMARCIAEGHIEEDDDE